MATVKLGATRSANRLISYAEKRAVEKEGIDCNPEYVKTQFKTTRDLYGKSSGIQAHHVIQSFAPGETTSRQANEIGQDLAKKIAKGHEAVVYTHADKDHIHNHIIINNVNYENGKKLQLHGQKAIESTRAISDELCKNKGLSVVKEPTAKVRYTLAEKSIIEKGKSSWKDELRQAIDFEKAHSKDYKDFKQNLTEKYGIEVNDKGKHITYKHPDHERVVRGNKLGLDYERGTIEHGFSRQIESNKNSGRTDSRESFERSGDFVNRNKRTEQIDAGLYKSSIERGNNKENDNGKRIGEYKKDQSRDSGENSFDFEKARNHSEQLRREASSSYGKWKDRNTAEQSKDFGKNGEYRGNAQSQHERDERKRRKELERTRKKNLDFDR